ncbi:MAG: phenylacetate--CoA ligase [Oscillospiraceae bacterium]|jgi:phenylacetate-CoA ligase|nr:phenylacetate--CoA ligase [Oscillospiraceae bacterium]
MYWNEKYETMSRGEMRELQGGRLRDAVGRVYKNVAAYRKKMDDAGITPEDIKGIDDLEKLPFTTKDDLRDTYPFGMTAVPMEEVTEIHASSGTTGKQTVVTYTQNDVDLWAEVAARSITMAGGTKKDIVHVSYGYGLFTGGLGAHYGGQTVGAATIPVSAGNTKRQLQIMTDFGSTILMCTPSYALYLAEAIEEAGIKDQIRLKTGIFGAEPWTEEMRREIERRLGIRAHDIYGLSEIIGPGVSCECEYQTGMHVQEDHFVPEIIDPETGKQLSPGTPGELAFTCITKEAMPLIRYRTKDISVLNYETCRCGRTTVRMLKPSGRVDDMLIIRGVNVFPSQIETVLMGINEASAHYFLVVDRIDNLDRLEIQVEMRPEFFSDEVRKLEELKVRIAKEMESTLGISASIRLVEPKGIKRSEGKAVRLQDNRKLY